MDKNFYSIPEAAKICGISRMTMYRWVTSGKIKAEKVGRTFSVPSSELAKCESESAEDWAEEIEVAVKRVVEEYGETLKLLGKE